MTGIDSSLKHELVEIAAGNVDVNTLVMWLGEHSVRLMESGSKYEREVIGELEHLVAEPYTKIDELVEYSQIVLSQLYSRHIIVKTGSSSPTSGDTSAGIATSTVYSGLG